MVVLKVLLMLQCFIFANCLRYEQPISRYTEADLIGKWANTKYNTIGCMVINNEIVPDSMTYLKIYTIHQDSILMQDSSFGKKCPPYSNIFPAWLKWTLEDDTLKIHLNTNKLFCKYFIRQRSDDKLILQAEVGQIDTFVVYNSNQ